MMDRGEFPHLTDSQFESVRKMVGIFGGDALRSFAVATPAEQVERIEAFDTTRCISGGESPTWTHQGDSVHGWPEGVTIPHTVVPRACEHHGGGDSVQILVVVANIQMRTLKTEVEKGSV
ncbi:Gag protein [Phytophthora palmivora]|uniref:Gag protein n=1 Tax=Phytophthora palmivora TaxID=4796 RepID=A0A2P4XRI4_9STRA|nr:Gag protein [Phytophthora palmivora]